MRAIAYVYIPQNAIQGKLIKSFNQYLNYPAYTGPLLLAVPFSLSHYALLVCPSWVSKCVTSMLIVSCGKKHEMSINMACIYSLHVRSWR